MNINLIELLWKKTKLENGHWLWCGAITGNGYPAININNDFNSVTKLSICIYHNKKYKDGWISCHLCKYRNCWNPLHLYPGTHSNNSNDIVKAGNHHEKIKTHCPYGHEYTKENTYYKRNTNKRECKICRRNQQIRFQGKSK